MLGGLRQSRILVVEDDEDMSALLRLLFEERHEVIVAGTGRDALSLAFTNPPDIVILDRQLPDLEGLEVLSELRARLSTRHVPVIMLTARAGVADRVAGLTSGADDYVAKPFDPGELMARVEGTLRRSRDALVTDPLTKLPGNEVLRNEIARALSEERTFCLCYVDLNNFKAYVDNYGFERASELIQCLAKLCYSCLMDHGAPEDFLGHLGGDDFFFLTGVERAQPLIDALLEAFDEVSPGFYSEADVERGCIISDDRFGVEREFPLTSLSVALIEVQPGDYANPRELAEFAAKCKSKVKRKNLRRSNSGSFRARGPSR